MEAKQYLLKLTNELSYEASLLDKKYRQLREQFMEYMNEEDINIKKINENLLDIQSTFFDLYPIIEHILRGHKSASEMCENHFEFIKEIQKNDPNHNIKFYRKEEDGTYTEEPYREAN